MAIAVVNEKKVSSNLGKYEQKDARFFYINI